MPTGIYPQRSTDSWINLFDCAATVFALVMGWKPDAASEHHGCSLSPTEGSCRGSNRLVHQISCAPGSLGVTSVLDGRRLRSPVRFTLTSMLGSGLDGAWWPHTVSLARELSDLTDALREPLGDVVDIGVNWSPLQGVADLDLLNRRGVAARSEEHTSELQSHVNLVCRLLL